MFVWDGFLGFQMFLAYEARLVASHSVLPPYILEQWQMSSLTEDGGMASSIEIHLKAGMLAAELKILGIPLPSKPSIDAHHGCEQQGSLFPDPLHLSKGTSTPRSSCKVNKAPCCTPSHEMTHSWDLSVGPAPFGLPTPKIMTAPPIRTKHRQQKAYIGHSTSCYTPTGWHGTLKNGFGTRAMRLCLKIQYPIVPPNPLVI